MLRKSVLLLIACCLVLCAADAPSDKADDAISSRDAGKLLLTLVNHARAKAGQSAVAFDPLASTLARVHADEMARHGYFGHYDLEGRKPEMRYNVLGGRDYVAENLAYLEAGSRMRLSAGLVRECFAKWMASESHRRNILAPGHTRMGYAFVMTTARGRSALLAVQEFVNHYGDYSALDRLEQLGTRLDLSGTFEPGVKLAFITLGREDLPIARSANHIVEADQHYRQPEPYAVALPAGESVPPGLAKVASLYGAIQPFQSGFHFRFDAPAQQCVLYVTVWVRVPGIRDPVRVMTQVVLVRYLCGMSRPGANAG